MSHHQLHNTGPRMVPLAHILPTQILLSPVRMPPSISNEAIFRIAMALATGLHQTQLICHLSEITAERKLRQETCHWGKLAKCLEHFRCSIYINLHLERLIVLVDRSHTLRGQRQRFLLLKGSNRTSQNRMGGLLRPDSQSQSLLLR